MNEEDLTKIGFEIVLKPVTEITENALGLLGGDWLSEKRRKNRERLREKTESELRRRNAKPDSDPSPTIAVPLLSAAQDESREELLNLWAKLLACALDQARNHFYRREFVEIAKALEPLDAVVLPMLGTGGSMDPSKSQVIAQRLVVTTDQVLLAFRNLERLELISPSRAGMDFKANPNLMPLGRQFLSAVSD